MLQTAKLFARRGSSIDAGSKHMNGLTFGEFCVLAADLKRFRTQNLTRCHDTSLLASVIGTKSTQLASPTSHARNAAANAKEVPTGLPKDTLEAEAAAPFDVNVPEVFLGGSCNPTTWRADVAIPALDKLGISFYNPVFI